MAVQLQFRRGTSSEWTSANPVLAAGEMGIETDTSLFKIGDGVTSWTSLSYGGLQGSQGIQGIQGATGPQGPQGDPTTVNGKTGASITLNSTDVGAVAVATVDAKGDLLVASADNTVTKLAVGTNDYVLTADSAEATGVKWAAASGGGGGGATGGGTDEVFYENDQTVTTSYTLTTDRNAMTAGPISIDAAATVTIPSGATWTVV